MGVLGGDELRSQLASLTGWEVEAGYLTKTWTVRDFSRGLVFLSAIGQLAEAANHHPDLTLHGYKHVTVRLVTHSEGGITEKDFALARQIEALPHKPPKPG